MDGRWSVVLDLSKYFHNFPTHPDDRAYLGTVHPITQEDDTDDKIGSVGEEDEERSWKDAGLSPRGVQRVELTHRTPTEL